MCARRAHKHTAGTLVYSAPRELYQRASRHAPHMHTTAAAAAAADLRRNGRADRVRVSRIKLASLTAGGERIALLRTNKQGRAPLFSGLLGESLSSAVLLARLDLSRLRRDEKRRA